MGVLSTLLVGTMLVAATLAACCDKNLIQELNFRVSGTDLLFPCASTKNIYTSTGRYIPKNVIATRMQIYKDDAIVALPRYRPGVPFTIGKFNLKHKGCKAQLEPYPCWSIQEEGNCKAIQNAIDLFLDPLDRLWVLDLGICNTLEQPVKRCDAKIWGMNAENGEIIKTVSLQSFVAPESRLQYVIVDYSADGLPFAYISDAGTGAIIVINLTTGSGYRVVLPPAVSADCPVKDILYMQLARKPSGNVVYFTYLSSPRMFSIKAEYLQTGQASGAVIDAGGKPEGTQVVLLGTDNGSAIFFRYKGESDVYIWNSDTCFKPDNFLLVQRGGECRMATQVVPGFRKLMWAIESNFHDYITNCTGCLGASMAIFPLVKSNE